MRRRGRSAVREYIKMWAKLLIAEKRKQMHSDELWPAFLPWSVNGVSAMPVAVWLSKPKDRKRGANDDGGEAR